MIKKTFFLVLIITSVLTLFGCQASSSVSDDYPPDIEDSPKTEYFITGDGTEGLVGYSSLERLLADIAISKFDERFIDGSDGEGFLSLRELYMPLKVPEGFELSGIISFRSFKHPISFEYTPGRTSFTWYRDRLTDDVRFQPDSDGRGAFRAQHGYVFGVRLNFPASFSEQELYYFSYAQPVMAWELQGNAVSMSVQGMRSIRILDEDGYEFAIESTNAHGGHGYLVSDLDHYTIYRIDGENRSVVGYRWRLDFDSARWQYVLEPGTYTFKVEGIIRDEVGLLVRHFDDHEIVSSVDYGAELTRDVSNFTITVTPTDSYLTINEY